MHMCHSNELESVVIGRLCVHSSCLRHRIGLTKVAGHWGSRGALGGFAHRRPKNTRVKRCADVNESFGRRRVVGVGVVRRLLRRCSGGSDVIQPRPRRVARRQRNAADDWVRFKTPACRTSCIMRSFSWRTANKQEQLNLVRYWWQRRKLQGVILWALKYCGLILTFLWRCNFGSLDPK